MLSRYFDVNPASLNSQFDRVSDKMGKVYQYLHQIRSRTTTRTTKDDDSETDAALFMVSRRDMLTPEIRPGNFDIKPSQSVECLGVVLQERLSWRVHALYSGPNS